MAEETKPRKVWYYEPKQEKSFEAWLNGLRDKRAKAKIDTRLDRLENGNFGDCESAGEGVIELKLDYGPGYRVYVGEEAEDVWVLWGGIKTAQQSDIGRARRYWREYKDAKKKS